MSYVVQDPHTIKETETGVNIQIPKNKNINELARKLNLGSGFNGFTPPFFAKFVRAQEYK